MKLLFALFVSLPIFYEGSTLKVKTDAVKISFEADMQNTVGSIGGFEATINFDPLDLTNSSIEGSVDVTTIQTGKPMRDEHLKSEDYFHAEKYPKMTFKSTKIEKNAGGFIMKGKMKIKDVEREETIVFLYAEGLFKGICTIQAANYNFGYEKKKPEKTNIIINFVIPVTE